MKVDKFIDQFSKKRISKLDKPDTTSRLKRKQSVQWMLDKKDDQYDKSDITSRMMRKQSVPWMPRQNQLNARDASSLS